MPTLPGVQTVYTGYQAMVGSVAYSPDGRSVLLAGTISQDSDGHKWAVLVDTRTGQEIRRLQGSHTDYVISVAFSPDGQLALTGSRDKTAILWDVTTGKALRTFQGKHTDWVSGVGFAPDGKTVATAGKDGQVWLWDAQTGAPIRSFEGHSDWVNTVVFSGDGKYILTGSDDNTARLWEVQSGKQVKAFDGSGKGISVAALSTDGRYVATGDEGSSPILVRVWDTTHPDQPPVTFNNSVDSPSNPGASYRDISSLSFAPGSRGLLIADYRGNILLWDWKTDQVLGRLTMPSQNYTVAAISPDGQTMVIGDFSGLTILDLKNLGWLKPSAPSTVQTPSPLPSGQP